MTYRHEWKHEINYQDRLILQTRLAAVMRPDPHAIDGRYRIRSLYFDTPADTALREKIDGMNRREKFRIRYYNGDTSYIVLKKKSKLNGLCAKESCRLTAEEARRIADGDFHFLAADDRPLCVELYAGMTGKGLRPKTIVDYTRIPFCFAPGNVRVMQTDLSKIVSVTDQSGNVTDLSGYTVSVNVPSGRSGGIRGGSAEPPQSEPSGGRPAETNSGQNSAAEKEPGGARPQFPGQSGAFDPKSMSQGKGSETSFWLLLGVSAIVLAAGLLVAAKKKY